MRRALRITSWTAGALFLLVIVLTASILIAGNTSAGRIWIERLTERLTDGRVRIAGLAGSFPAAIDIQRLQLSDAKRVIWMTGERISLRWAPLALLARHVNVERLSVARLAIEQIPSTDTTEKSNTRLPYIDVQQLSIGALELGPQLAGMRATLAVQGAAHLISLQNAAAHIAARRTDGQGGDYEITLRFDPARMDARIKLDEPSGGALANLLHYPGLGALSVVASLNGPRTAEHIELNARADKLQAHAQGSIDLNGESADLVYSLSAPAMTPRPGLSWKEVALQGRWQGRTGAPRAEGRLTISALKIPGGVNVETLDAQLNAQGGDVALRATAAGIVLPGSAPRLLAASPLRVDATTHLKDPTRAIQLSVEQQLFQLQAHLVTTPALSGSFDLHVRDLAPLAALAHESIRGTSELKGTLEQSGANMHLTLDAGMDIKRDESLLGKLLGGASRLQLAAALTERSVDIEHLLLNGRILSVSADGSAQRGLTIGDPAVQSLRAHYAVNVRDLAVFAPALAGTVKLNGSLDGPATDFAAQLQLTSDLSVQGSAREPIQAGIKARGLPSQPSATLQAQGRFGGAPVEFNASLTSGAGGAVHVAVQRGEWKSAHLEGNLTATANMASASGDAHLRIDRLADLQTLLGSPIEGSLDASLALRPVNQHTQAQLQLDAKNIVVADITGNAHLSGSGPIDNLSLQVAAQSPNLKGEPASLEAAARLNYGAHELALQRMQLHYHAQALRLLSPARLMFTDGFAISKLKLGVQRAVIELDGRVSPVLALNASMHQIEPALVNAFVPDTLAQGRLDVDAQLAGAPSAPSGLVTVKATGVRFANAAARDLHALDLNATARLKENAAQVDARLSAGSESQLALSGNAPLNAAGNLNLKLTGKLNAALANAVLEARGERAEGVLAIDASVTGNSGSPQIEGTVDLAQGDLRDYGQGLHLSGITAHLIGSHGTLEIVSLVAHASPGELSLTGSVGILQPKIPLDLKLAAQNAQPVASDIFTSNLNADLRIKGTLRERIDMSGTVNLNRTIIGIPNALPPDVAVLDVRRPGQAAPRAAQSNLVIALDVKLHAPRELLVQGRGLNAELGGDVHFGGTTDSLVASGGFDLIRGTLSLAGSQLTFTNGRVAFNGAGLRQKIDPILDFTAETTSADATSTLHITGFADAPQFELSSSPPLPQDEILARLLFGESASQLTVLQVAQIGAALGSLSGVGSGANPLAKVQRALGLDRLSVGGGSSTGASGQTSGAAVEAGRYVSKRVFVGATQSTTGFSQVEVDVDLSKHLKLQTRLGNGTATTQGTTPENDPGSSVGLMYQFEY